MDGFSYHLGTIRGDSLYIGPLLSVPNVIAPPGIFHPSSVLYVTSWPECDLIDMYSAQPPGSALVLPSRSILKVRVSSPAASKIDLQIWQVFAQDS